MIAVLPATNQGARALPRDHRCSRLTGCLTRSDRTWERHDANGTVRAAAARKLAVARRAVAVSRLDGTSASVGPRTAGPRFRISLIRGVSHATGSRDLSGRSKAGWTIFVIVLPFLGVFVSLTARGREMSEHKIEAAQAQEVQFHEYVQQAWEFALLAAVVLVLGWHIGKWIATGGPGAASQPTRHRILPKQAH
jgi:hypothetical protein